MTHGTAAQRWHIDRVLCQATSPQLPATTASLISIGAWPTSAVAVITSLSEERSISKGASAPAGCCGRDMKPSKRTAAAGCDKQMSDDDLLRSTRLESCRGCRSL